jgi:hypothetical protein
MTGRLGGMVVVVAALGMCPAHAGDVWKQQDHDWNSQRSWGQLEPGRTQSYYDYQGPDGAHHRCAVSQWRGEPQLRCD